MSFELDPLFHTETMVKILKSQGHFQLALKVCGKILEKDPARTGIRTLMEKLRSPFPRAERGHPEEEDDTTDPGVSIEELQTSEEAKAVSSEDEEKAQKLEKLQALLQKVQERS